MAENHESTMKWKVDISQLKAAMQDAKRSISLANAEFKAATAGMDKWQNSTTGLEAKIRQLNQTLPQQRSILQQLEQQYKLVAENQGENSAEAQRLKIQIENQKAAIGKTESSIGTYNKKLKEMQTAESQLTNVISKQEAELSDLKTAYVNAVAQYGKNSKEAKALASQISSLSGELAKNKAKQSEASKEADKLDKSLDEVGDSADETTTDVKELDNGFTVLKGTMANLAAEAIKGLINGFAQLGKAMINVGKQAIMSYADYEQLVGGVETLFGAGGQSIEEYANSVGKTVNEVKGEYSNMMKAQASVLNNASKAYKTAGMSQNEYMETVTGFSATLIQSLDGDTAKAAEIANQAIIDMSDNANKMGTDMASIQNAYQGFAKQNYTMLDNLKLGYGGTKEEMQRLLEDATAISGIEYDIKNYADVVEAINVIQTDLGITGTTAKEAMTTITGSLNMTKSAWSNLLTGMADDSADFDALIDGFVESALAFGGNVAPRIKTVISGMGKMISGLLTELVPTLLEEVPSLIEESLPILLTALGSVGQTLLSILPDIISSISGLIPSLAESFVSAAPQLISAGSQIIVSLIQGITDSAPTLIAQIPVLVKNILDGLIENLPQILIAGMSMLQAIVEGINSALPTLIAYIPVLVENFCTMLQENLPQILEMGVTLLVSLIQGITTAIPLLVSYLPSIIQTICDTILPLLPMILSAGVQILLSLLEGLISMLPELVVYIPQIIDTILTILTENLPSILEMGIDILMSLINGIIEALPQLLEYAPKLITSIVTVLTTNLPKIIQMGIQILVKLINGLTQAIPQLISMIPSIISTIVTVLLQNLPQILAMGVQILWELISGIGSVLGSLGSMAGQIFSTIWGVVSQIPAKMLEVGKNLVQGIWSGISNSLQWIKDKLTSWIGNVTSFIKKLFGIGSPSKVMAEEVGKWLPAGMAEGFKDDMPDALSSMKQSLTGALSDLKSDVAMQTEGMFGDINLNGSGTGIGSNQQIVNFSQIINSPKAVDGMTLYRETNNLLFSAKVRLGNV